MIASYGEVGEGGREGGEQEGTGGDGRGYIRGREGRGERGKGPREKEAGKEGGMGRGGTEAREEVKHSGFCPLFLCRKWLMGCFCISL